MDIICGDRGCGKTTKLIKKSAVFGGVIVCFNKKEAERVAFLAEVMNLNIRHPITYDDFLLKRYYPHGIKELYIDNADLLLQYMANVNIKSITITKENED